MPETQLLSKNFATVLYPESAPTDWVEKLESLHIPAFISPCHCLDKKPDGELKKPHWHVLLMLPGRKSPKSVRPLLESFGGVGCEVVNHLTGYARYLCHLDCTDTNHYKYPVGDVIELSGANYSRIIEQGVVDKNKAIREMVEFIRKDRSYKISFAKLFEYAVDYRPDWMQALCSSSVASVIDRYLLSRINPK